MLGFIVIDLVPYLVSFCLSLIKRFIKLILSYKDMNDVLLWLVLLVEEGISLQGLPYL